MAYITDAMDDLRQLLVDGGVTRPVVVDPRNIVAPCVLIEPPTLNASGVLCGPQDLTFRVIVVGLPGARAELEPLARLLDEVLAALPGYAAAEPIGYVPLASPQSAEPSQAYRITIGALV